MALVCFLSATSVKGQASSLESFSFQELKKKDLSGGWAWGTDLEAAASGAAWCPAKRPYLGISSFLLDSKSLCLFGLKKPFVVVVDSRKGAATTSSFFFLVSGNGFT